MESTAKQADIDFEEVSWDFAEKMQLVCFFFGRESVKTDETVLNLETFPELCIEYFFTLFSI